MIHLKVKRLIGAKELVSIVMEFTPEEVEKISEGIIFDIGESKLLWLVERSWIIIQVRKDS